jgi:hypothetical protein
MMLRTTNLLLLTMQTHAHDDEGRGDEVEMELQSVEGRAIDTDGR